jgi:two-component sensor histidine kinase
VREGSFGDLPAAVATPLAMVLTELVQNAVEHGFPDGTDGTVRVLFVRTADALRVEVVDDGAGLPAGFVPEASRTLGLQIVRTLVVSELRGSLELAPADGRGTRVEVVVPLPGTGAGTGSGLGTGTAGSAPTPGSCAVAPDSTR